MPDDDSHSTFNPSCVRHIRTYVTLRSYTINAAFAAFEEKQKGSLTAGKLADVVVLSRDILTCRDDELPNVQVLYTIVGGKVLFPNE